MRPRPLRPPALFHALLVQMVLASVTCYVVPAQNRSPLMEQVKRDTAWFAGYPSRVAGTSSHDQAIAALRERLLSFPGVTVYSESFDIAVPLVQTAELVIREGPAAGSHHVYPFWPASVRLQTTPREGYEGRLVYVGHGTPSEMPARSLRGQIAVMELVGGNNWADAYNAGANAILLLGSPDVSRIHTARQVQELPIHVPRYFVPDGPLADVLRSSPSLDGHLTCHAVWTSTQATNLYALVPARYGAAPQRALAIVIQSDAMSAVPELAPGADSAVDVALALAALRTYSQNPPERPLLFAFVDAYGFNQRGLREMLATLSPTTRNRRKYIDLDNTLVRTYETHAELAAAVNRLPDPLAVLHQPAYAGLQRYVKDEVAREVVVIETELFPLRLAVAKAEGPEHDRLAVRINTLAQRRGRFFAAQRQLLTRAELPAENRLMAAELWARACARIEGQLQQARMRAQRHQDRTLLRLQMLEALGLSARDESPIEFVFGVDLSDAGVAAGPQVHCAYLQTTYARNAREFIAWLGARASDELERIWPAPLAQAVNLGPLRALESAESYVVGNQPALTSPAESFGFSAVTWATLDALRPRLDTPYDTADRLDWQRLGPQVEATLALLHRMATQTDFRIVAPVVGKWCRIFGVVVDQSPGEPVPRLPMPGYLTTLIYGGLSGAHGRLSGHMPPPGIRRQEYCFTGVDGYFQFDAQPSLIESSADGFFVQSCLLGDDGRILRAVDMGKSGKNVVLGTGIRGTDPRPMRAVTFTCEEMTVTRLFDPRFLLSLPMATLLDTRRSGPPQRFNAVLGHGLLSALLEPDTRWQLILRAGTTRNRFALLNVSPPKHTIGESTRDLLAGFPVGQRLLLSPTHQAAQDFFRLDEQRVHSYRRAGITSEAIDAIRQTTGQLLNQAAQALAVDAGGSLYRATSAALANEVRAYHAVREMANDVIRAAIFLLLGLVPFAYVTERLLVATTNVYRQILTVGLIFAIMTAMLWSFHPAFRISSQPLMIIMAFGIIFMSLLVISVVYSKFEAGLEEMRSGRTETSGAETWRGGVLSSAFQLGIANMRRRKTRTLLTGLTVVVITFTLLCFTSTSSYVGSRETRLAKAAPYTGVLIRQPGRRQLPFEAFEHLQQILGATRTVVPRFWWTDPRLPQWRIHLRHERTGKQLSLQAGLGLCAGEEQLTGVSRYLPQWERFGRGEGVYIERSAAEELAIQPGEHLIVAGRSLELLGVYDAHAVNDAAGDLDGQSLLPTDYTTMNDETRAQHAALDVITISSEMESGAGLQADLGLRSVSSNAVVILPGHTLRGTDKYQLQSIAVPTETHAEAQALARALSQSLAFPIYYGSPEGTHVIASTIPLPQGPTALLIPLLIGGLIIFNTLLGSIAERRREIHVFTSMGLAPLHVGALFLAEGLTYGLLGSIFGYVAGQGLATLLAKAGLLGELTLNYSGTHAITTMLMVMVVVVLASLFPAYMAGRLAVPSSDMTWRVPEPRGDTIEDTLPFTVTPRTANGVMFFLYEYLEVHREGGVGDFSTDDLRADSHVCAGHEMLRVAATVWLAPYDLGIRQQVQLWVAETDLEDVLEIHIRLVRGSGQVASWRKLNRVFLGDVRRQLLGWRKLRLARMSQYIADSARLRTIGGSDEHA